MKGNFAVHFFDLIIYFVPGMITVYFGSLVIFHFYKDIQWYHSFTTTEKIAAFLLISYIIGHALHTLSYLVTKIGYYFKRNHSKIAIESINFKDKLKDLLEEYLSISDLSNYEIFQFSLRIASEHMPTSNQTIDRQYAIMLFCRSMILTLLFVEFSIVLLIILSFKIYLIIGIVIIPILIFLHYKRFRQQQLNYFITIYRSCYIWLIDNKNE